VAREIIFFGDNVIDFYKSQDSPPTFTGNWVRQLRTVITNFPNTQFVRVQGVTTSILTELQSIPNLTHQFIDDFMQLLIDIGNH
jgi:hypothetical protein